ncbi:MAG: hypothetical protein KF799_09710 [Bdellovibrionales bacterium]|nr:hypothetical protein [Bdellovibrionales bacterium]
MNEALLWTGRLIALALILQSLELLRVKPYAWSVVQREIPLWLRPFVRPYSALLWLRLLSGVAVLIFPTGTLAVLLLLTTWLTAVRWRGTFNGGSDTMAVQILLAWSVSLLFPATQTACVLYIALQVLLSYVVAGVAKLREPEWRDGRALMQFTAGGLGGGSVLVARAPALWSWLVIAFECSFPLALLGPTMCLGYISAALVFHIANFYIFGLNRFVFVWLAAYPALYASAA